MSDCTFNAERHEYRIAGRLVPSVTKVLGDMLPCWRASDWHLQRGRSVHACAAMIARGETFQHDPQIDGQVRALRRFFAEVKLVVYAVEESVFSQQYQYGGTLDLLTRNPKDGKLMVLDFKSTLTKAVPYQCAAYALARGGRTPIIHGVGCEIREDGKYQMGTIEDLRPYGREWLGLLSAYNTRRKCGIKTEDESDGQ